MTEHSIGYLELYCLIYSRTSITQLNDPCTIYFYGSYRDMPLNEILILKTIESFG